MQIVIHAGAHGTEEERLFRTLLRNRDEFAKRGVAIPPPGRYRPLLREMLGALTQSEPPDDIRDILLDAILDDDSADRVILSHPHIFGTEKACIRRGSLYVLAPLHMQILDKVFSEDDVTLCIAMRDPASFLPLLYEASPQESLPAFLRGQDPLDLRWSDTLESIRAASPRTQIITWCFEDMPIIWAQIIREIAGLDHGQKIVGGFDLLSQITSKEGMMHMREYFKQNPSITEIQKRQVIAEVLELFALDEAIEEEITVPGWTQDLMDDLTALYEEDMLRCARMPGVQMITP